MNECCNGQTECSESQGSCLTECSKGEWIASQVYEMQNMIRTTVPDSRERSHLLTLLDQARSWSTTFIK